MKHPSERKMISQVDPYPAVVDQNVLHLEVRLAKRLERYTPNDYTTLTCSASSLLSNSMNAYCRESPVRLSRMT